MKSCRVEYKQILKRMSLNKKTKTSFAQFVGRELKYARHILGFTQVEIASILAIEQSALSRIESGDQKMCGAQSNVVNKMMQLASNYVHSWEAQDEKEKKRIQRIQRRIYGG